MEAEAWRSGLFILNQEEYVRQVREFPSGTATVTTDFRYDYTEAATGTFRATVTDARGNDTGYTLREIRQTWLRNR